MIPLHSHTLRRAAAILAILPLALAGCVNAGKRYEQGLTLEARGQPAEAARRYADALRRDPSLTEARARLQESGRLAVDHYLVQARTASDAGRASDAAEALLALDDLRGDISAVGVELAVPEDYGRYRRGVLDQAIESALDQGAASAEAGRWNEALTRLQRTARWQPSAEQRRRADEARLETYSAWMAAEGAAGRHRSAFGVGEQARTALGAQFPGMERIAEAQQFAIDEGTLRVAVLPIGTTRTAGRLLGGSFLRDAENEMEASAWTRPPAFVEMIDPRELRMALRRYDVTDPHSVSQSVRVGRAVDADLVVAVEIDSVAFPESEVTLARRAVRTRDGADTAWTVRAGRRQAWAQVRYLVYDVASSRLVSQERLVADASRNFREGVYAGDWRQLLLSDEDRRLFDVNRRDDERGDLVTLMARDLAEALPRVVYERVLREVR
jgi:tetratricopeptide (TPR) repeat protein